MALIVKKRKTAETEIELALDICGGPVQVETGVGFFDHMLTAFAVHAGYGLTIRCRGDLHVDAHHTVEDVGIVLGQALAESVGDKSAIARYGSFYIPMDEALAFVCVDISGRAYLHYEADLKQEKTGDFDTCLAVEFFRALANHAGLTLHVRCLYGENAHHQLEAMFKAAGHALAQATAPRQGGVLSTKGSLE